MLGPTLLRVRLGVDEVVTTLLLNFVVLLFVQMMLEGPLKDPMGGGWPQSAPILPEGTLPPLFERMRLHAGFIVALIASRAIYVLIARTVLGLKIRAVGENAGRGALCRHPGDARDGDRRPRSRARSRALPARREVAGLKGYLTADMSRGFGYAGIVVAMIAGLDALAVVPAAIFIAGIFVGADTMGRTLGVSNYIADLIVALVAAVRAGQRAVRALPHPAAHEWTACSTSCSPRASGPPRSASRRRYMFGVLGALLCERSGVLNLGIEGIFTAGAMAGWMSVYLGADLWTGVLIAALTGAIDRAAARAAHRAARPVAARHRHRHHAVRDLARLFHLSPRAAERRDAADHRAVPPAEYPGPVRPAVHRRRRCSSRRR